MPEFDDELDRIVREHRYLVRTANREFEGRWNEIMSQPSDGEWDGGDAFAWVQDELGINPFDVEGDAGLAAIGRAVSLAEVTFARIAAAHFTDPDRYVFPNGNLWYREWEELFFKQVLNTPFHVNSNGFGSLRDLRDLYAHGYGVPATEARRDRLAVRLYSDFPSSPPNAEEASRGYIGDAYWFGKYTSFDTRSKSLVSDLFLSRNADVSELAAYRALNSIGTHVHALEMAVWNGVITDISEDNRFFRKVDDWWNQRSKSSIT
ncbi:MAG: hypothetical protein AB7K08_07765 [Microbacteriaceae bacterium]